MSFTSIHAPLRRSRTLAALSLSFGLTLALTACGGGTDPDPTAASSTSASTSSVVALDERAASVARSAAAPVSVTVAGCVLDRHYIPATGIPVRALAADGRLLGNAQSDAQGRFTLRLPADSQVVLQVDRPSGESLPMRVGAATSTWETCLLDEST